MSSNHTIVTGHGEDDEKSVLTRLVNAYSAGKDTSCPYVAHRLVTSTVVGSLSFDKAPVYGRSSAGGEKTSKSKSIGTLLESTIDDPGVDVPCHHPSCVT